MINMKQKAKKILGVLLIIFGIFGGLYVGVYSMFIQPIIEACKAFDAGNLTGMIIGTTILKCIFAGAVGSIILYVCCKLGVWLMEK